jgi:hypothetical protein
MKMTLTFRRLGILFVAMTLAALTGCASTITHQDMTPAPAQLAKQHPQTVSVVALPMAAGDREGAAATMSELRTALSNAISTSKAFSKVAPEGGDYQLSVQIFSINHPSFGVSFTSKVEMGWTLKRADNGALIWQEAIKSEHTTGGMEAFSGAERVKMSIVGAIKNNITTGLTRISALAL